MHSGILRLFTKCDQTAVDSGDLYPSNKSRLFWLQDKPEDPQFEPHARIKMVQVMGSPLYIGGGGVRNNFGHGYLLKYILMAQENCTCTGDH